MGPKFAFFDSNTWIYLANGFNVFSNKYEDLHFKVFEILEKRVSDGSLVIFTNEIIKEEWARHQDDAAHQIGLLKNKSKSYKDQLRTISAYIGQTKEQLDELIKAVDEETDKKILQHEQHIDRVKKFIEAHTDVIVVSDQHRIEASQMAQRKQAPFLGDKSNSMSDALILLSITDFLNSSKKNNHPAVKYALGEDGVVESYFVTSNFSDFAALPNKHKIHPDLEPILARSGTEYQPSLGLLINDLEKEFLTQDELRAIEDADRSTYCEVCNSEYASVQFSATTNVFDPFKFEGYVDPNQLTLFDTEMENLKDEPFVDLETAYCDHCNADYVVCPNCQEMVHVKENEKTPCTGCYYKFMLDVERDRKGLVHGYSFTIIRDFTCSDCGDEFDEFSELGLCETCEEYRVVAEIDYK